MTKQIFNFIFCVLLLTLCGCDENSSAGSNGDTDLENSTDSSQDSDGAPIEIDGQYVESVSLIREWSLAEIETAFALLQIQAPDVDFSQQLQSGVSVYKLIYQTEYQTTTITASALLAVPQTTDAVPVLSFQNGTNTQYAAAPTEDADGMLMRIISSTAAFGYAVLVADYIGFGESTQLFHPYLCKEITAISLADMLRATVELEESKEIELELTGDLFLAGYSQGGYTTMALHEYLETEPEFPLVLQATAAGAGPYDLNSVNDYVQSGSSYEQPYYGPYTVLAFQSLGFINEDLSTYFAAPYAETIPDLFDGINSSDQINEALTTDISALYTSDLLTNLHTAPEYESLLTAFDENSIFPFATQIPLKLFHGSNDTYIPPQITLDFQAALIDAGTDAANIEYIEISDEDHQSAGTTATVNAIQWFNELNGY